MKKYFAVAAILALTSLSGLAQTTTTNTAPTYNTAPTHKESKSNWSGFYVGVNIGEALGTTNARTSTVNTGTGYFATSSIPAVNSTGNMNLDLNGITGGGQVGYNHQMSHWVLGVEGDFEALSTDASKTRTTTYPCCSPTTFTIAQRVSTDWIATVRPRVGVVLGRHTLVFVSGGGAETEIHYTSVFTDTFDSAVELANVPSALKTGWTAGAGVEFALNHHWSVRPEYLHAGFGNASSVGTVLTSNLGSSPANVFHHTADLNTDLFRFAVNYKF